MAESVTFTLEGLARLERFFKKLPAKVQQDSLKKAATFATTPLLKSTRQEAPEDLGGLRERFVKKVKVYRHSGSVLAMVGLDANKPTYYHGRKKRGGSGYYPDHPDNILHLLTFGKTNRDGSRTPPNRFQSRAFKSTLGQMKLRFKSKLKRDLPKDIARLKTKGVLTV